MPLSPASNLEELLEQMHEVFKGVNKTVGDMETRMTILPTQDDIQKELKAIKAETHEDMKEQAGNIRQGIMSDVQGDLQAFKDSLNQHQHAVGDMIRKHEETVKDLIREFKEKIPDMVDKRLAKTVDDAIEKRNDAARDRWVKRVKQASIILAFAGLLATTVAQCAGYQLPQVKEKSEQFNKLGR